MPGRFRKSQPYQVPRMVTAKTESSLNAQQSETGLEVVEIPPEQAAQIVSGWVNDGGPNFKRNVPPTFSRQILVKCKIDPLQVHRSYNDPKQGGYLVDLGLVRQEGIETFPIEDRCAEHHIKSIDVNQVSCTGENCLLGIFDGIEGLEKKTFVSAGRAAHFGIQGGEFSETPKRAVEIATNGLKPKILEDFPELTIQNLLDGAFQGEGEDPWKIPRSHAISHVIALSDFAPHTDDPESKSVQHLDDVVQVVLPEMKKSLQGYKPPCNLNDLSLKFIPGDKEVQKQDGPSKISFCLDIKYYNSAEE